MLQNNLELIVQYPSSQGYQCRGFRVVRLTAPAYVVFDGADITDQGVADLLGRTFCEEVLRHAGAIEETAMPCSGEPGSLSCDAMGEPTYRKIFVRLAATGGASQPGMWPTPCADAQWMSRPSDPTWEVIPAMPAGSDVAANVPAPWRGINVCFWTRHPVEVLWAVMQRSRLAPEDSRLFISYVRRDTTPVADQLFEALTQQGFDVFLDRCSVPIGIQFQERLMQDLCDKAMAVLLNSPSVAQSYWVEEEIANIKIYRLGLVELRFPGGQVRRDIDPDFTRVIEPTDLVSAGSAYAAGSEKLSPAALAGVVDRIKMDHGVALHRRRYELIDSFAAALAAVGRPAQALPDGTFLLPSQGSKDEAVVNLMARPPELGDFCALHQRGGVSANRAGWLISPAPFFVAQRQAQVSWLGGVSNIQHANEAQIRQLAAKL